MTTLREVLPPEFFSGEYDESPAAKYLDSKVELTITDYLWPRAAARFVDSWWVLEDGHAVAWNESPRGMSFPVAKLTQKELTVLGW